MRDKRTPEQIKSDHIKKIKQELLKESGKIPVNIELLNNLIDNLIKLTKQDEEPKRFN